MAVTGYLYGHFLESLLMGDINDMEAAVYKCMLTTNAYTPNQDTHQDKADVTNEVVGAGYAAGGATLANKAVTQTNNVVKFDCDDITWAASTITARRAVVYDDTEAADADKKLVGWIDFGADESSVAGEFKITIAAGGLFTLTATDAP